METIIFAYIGPCLFDDKVHSMEVDQVANWTCVISRAVMVASLSFMINQSASRCRRTSCSDEDPDSGTLRLDLSGWYPGSPEFRVGFQTSGLRRHNAKENSIQGGAQGDNINGNHLYSVCCWCHGLLFGGSFLFVSAIGVGTRRNAQIRRFSIIVGHGWDDTYFCKGKAMAQRSPLRCFNVTTDAQFLVIDTMQNFDDQDVC
jgi:hypothetical protein